MHNTPMTRGSRSTKKDNVTRPESCERDPSGALPIRFDPSAAKSSILSATLEAGEAALRAHHTDINQRKVVATTLAENYLSAGRPQEAIWTLKSGGFTAQAQIVSEQLKQFLLSARIVNTVANRYGIEGSEIVTLSGNYQAIAKARVSADAMIEPIAYQVDELFSLDVVPTTVWREDLRGSVQIWIHDAPVTGISCKGRDPYPNQEAWKRMSVLDFFIEHADRNGENSLFRLGKNVVAIDHCGGTFLRDLVAADVAPDTAPDYEPDFEYRLDHLPSEEFSKNVARVTDKQIANTFAWVGSQALIDNFITKLNLLRTAYGLPVSMDRKPD